MIRSLHEGEGTILGFDYLPEQASLLYDYTEKKTGAVYEARGFAKYLDVPRFVKMFLHASPAQMEDIRKAFVSLYRQGSLLDRLRDDLPAIEQIVSTMETEYNSVEMDKIQQLQCNWFIQSLKKVRDEVLR